MKVDHFRNDDVEVYGFHMAVGEELILDPPVGPDQQAFFEENGWAYVYGVTVLLEGEITISSVLFPDTTTIRPDHDLWINGVDRMSGTPHIFSAVTDAHITCLTYRDHHRPQSSDKIMLADMTEHLFDAPGWVYVAAGNIICDGIKYPSTSLLKIETVGKIGTASEDTVISFIGL